jgi:hypothetical protein
VHEITTADPYRFKAMEAEKVRAYLKRCEEMSAAGESKRLEETVNSWEGGSCWHLLLYWY